MLFATMHLRFLYMGKNTFLPRPWQSHTGGSKKRPLKENKWPRSVRKLFFSERREAYIWSVLYLPRNFTTIIRIDTNDYATIRWVFMEKEDSKKIMQHRTASNWEHQKLCSSHLTSKFKNFFKDISGWSSIGYNRNCITGLTTCIKQLKFPLKLRCYTVGSSSDSRAGIRVWNLLRKDCWGIPTVEEIEARIWMR